MPRVHGVQINDDHQQEKTASQLLGAHAAATLISVAIALIWLIVWLATKDAATKFYTAVDAPSWQAGSESDIFLVTFYIAVPIGTSAAVYFLARSAVQNNSMSVLQGICYLDAYCVYCSVMGTLYSIQLIVYWFGIGDMSNHCADGQSGGSRDGLVRDCETAVGALGDIKAANMGLWICVVILCMCQLGVCVVAMIQANKAQQTLKQGKVFVGPPPVYMVRQVGQPMINTVVVGRPVGAEASAASVQGTPC